MRFACLLQRHAVPEGVLLVLQICAESARGACSDRHCWTFFQL